MEYIDRCAGRVKKLNLRPDSQRHRHFVGFLACLYNHRNGPTFWYGYSDTPPHLVAFYDTDDVFSISTPAFARGTGEEVVPTVRLLPREDAGGLSR